MYEYCPHDGAELDTTETGIAKKGTCPDCAETYTRTPVDTLLFNLPNGLRSPLDATLQWLLQRPRTTGGLSTLRALALYLIVQPALNTLGYGGVGIVAGFAVAGIAFFASVTIHHGQGGPDANGRTTNYVDVLLLAAVIANNWSIIAEHGTGIIDKIPTAIDLAPDAIAGFASAMVAVYAVGSVGIVVHEYCHLAVLRAMGHEGRITVMWRRIAGQRIWIEGGEMLPRPYSWTGEPWEHAAVSLAPLAMWVPVAAVLVSMPFPLPSNPVVGGLLLGGGIGWMVASLPSGGDLSNMGHGRLKRTADMRDCGGTHREAEGIA